jgi:hypothetical protein
MVKRNSRRNRQLGGNSAWQYVSGQVGDGWTQFQNALTLDNGNQLVQVGATTPNTQNIQNKTMSGGKRRKGTRRKGTRRKGRRQKGGNIGAVISNAIVPFSLVGLNNFFGKRKSRKH